MLSEEVVDGLDGEVLAGPALFRGKQPQLPVRGSVEVDRHGLAAAPAWRAPGIGAFIAGCGFRQGRLQRIGK